MSGWGVLNHYKGIVLWTGLLTLSLSTSRSLLPRPTMSTLYLPSSSTSDPQCTWVRVCGQFSPHPRPEVKEVSSGPRGLPLPCLLSPSTGSVWGAWAVSYMLAPESLSGDGDQRSFSLIKQWVNYAESDVLPAAYGIDHKPVSELTHSSQSPFFFF